jgi:hypothetical protein
MMRNEREFEKEFGKDYVLLTRNGMKHVGRASQNQKQKHLNKYGGLYAYKGLKHQYNAPKFAFKLHQKLNVNKPSKQVKRHSVALRTSSRHHKPTYKEIRNSNSKKKSSKQEEMKFSRMTKSEFAVLIKNHLKYLLKNERVNGRKQRPSNTVKNKKKRSQQNQRLHFSNQNVSKMKINKPAHTCFNRTQIKTRFEISNDLKNLHRDLQDHVTFNKLNHDNYEKRASEYEFLSFINDKCDEFKKTIENEEDYF